MYYSYRRRSFGSSFFLWFIISAVVILLISPRARRRARSWLGSLSSYLMGFGKDIGRQVNRVGINITDKFRTYKLADLAGSIKQTFTAKRDDTISVKEEDASDIVFRDLTSDKHDNNDLENDTNPYRHNQE